MITRLDPQQIAAGQRFVAAPEHLDHSSDGACSIRPAADTVVLTTPAGTRTLGVGHEVVEASVSDDGGTVAVIAKRDGKQVVGLVDGDDLKVLVPDTLTHCIDVSPDGTQIASTSCYDLDVTDRSGNTRRLAHMPVFIDQVEYVPGGQLLARGTANGWGGPSAPAWYLVDPASGGWNMVTDLDEAERLGPSVRTPLLEQYAAAYPGAPLDQRKAMMEKYGYQMPTFRQSSPDRKHMIFDMGPLRLDPSQPGEPGTYAFTAGGGMPVRLSDPSAGSVLGARGLESVVWAGSSRRAAVVFKAPSASEHQMLGVSLDEGARFQALPLDVDGQHVHWSPDEHFVAFDVLDGQRHIVYVFDADRGTFYPVTPDASVQGWDGPNLRVKTPDGRETRIPALPLDPELGGGLVLGSPNGRKPAGEVKVDGDHVDIGGIRIPRRQG